jgi:hypothetical protein
LCNKTVRTVPHSPKRPPDLAHEYVLIYCERRAPQTSHMIR